MTPGTRLGRYEIGAAIGAGGMGEIYRACDTRLGRDVAIKVLPERLLRDSSSRQRFEREARTVAALSHPNILAIHDFGEDEGMTYAVMELLEGETLRRRLVRGPIGLEHIRDYALQIARGLAAAHARGIVHRDLKPENIFLPDAGPLKILDFGLARTMALDPEHVKETRAPDFRTATGLLLGTVGYMAPEQVRGVEADHRSDICAFGTVLYEMLTGQRPFQGETPFDLMSAIVNHEPQPLPEALKDDAAGLGEVAMRCLERDPDDRYQATTDMVAALDRVTPTSGGRKRAAPSGTMAGAAAFSIAVLPFSDMTADKSCEFLCDGIAEEIQSTLGTVDGLRVVARSSAFQFKGRSEDVRRIGRALDVGTVLDGSVRAAGKRLRIVTQLVDTANGYQLWSERFDRDMDDVFAVQDEIAEAVVRTLRMHITSTLPSVVPAHGTPDLDAYILYLKGRYLWNKRTEDDLKKSVDQFQAAIDRDPRYAQAYAGLAESELTLGLYGALPPVEVMPRARAAAERALELAGTLGGPLASLGCIHAIYDWAWPQAEACFRHACDAGAGDSPAQHWYAINFLVPRARFDEAGVALARARQADPLSLPINASFGARSYFARQYERARAELSAALELDAGFANARYFLGLTLAEVGRYDEALSALDQAARSSGSSPEMMAAAGYVAARAGHRDQARAAVAALTARSQERYVSPSLIAQILTGLGDAAGALDWLERAAEVRAADLAWLAVRPVFDTLRTEMRFAALLERMSLPGSTAGSAARV